MAKPQYQTPEYRRAKKALGREIDAGQGWCVQGEPGTESSGRCVHRTRHIAPGEPWAVAHNDAGTVVIGAAHRACNARDGATRGNLQRAGVTRWSI